MYTISDGVNVTDGCDGTFTAARSSRYDPAPPCVVMESLLSLHTDGAESQS